MRHLVLMSSLAALAVSCNSGEVAQPADIAIGQLHNKALAWVLSDLQVAKQRLGSAWKPEVHLLAEADRSEARFLAAHPTVDRNVYYQFKTLLLSGPMTAHSLHEVSPEAQAAGDEVYAASEQYWTDEGSKWAALVGLQAFPAAMRQSPALKKVFWADAYGAIGGFAAGGPAGAVAGAIAASLGTALGILIVTYFVPPTGVTL